MRPNAYFVLCRALGWLLRSARYSKTCSVERHVRKRRVFYAPLLIAMGAVKDGPVIEDGKLVVAKTMRLCATFDHRLLDGAHAAAMARTVRAWMEDPFHHFDPIPRSR